MFVTIALLLLNIVGWLREQRQDFGDLVSRLSDGAVARPVVESSLLPTRVVQPLIIVGALIVGAFFFTITPVRDLNFNYLLTLQFAGEAGSFFQSALRLDHVLAPVTTATRMIGVALLMLAIGVALVTIVINLRATALLLPSGFSKLIAVAQVRRLKKTA